MIVLILFFEMSFQTISVYECKKKDVSKLIDNNYVTIIINEKWSMHAVLYLRVLLDK